jgi:iron complex transport system ATP-binding protein
MKAVELTRVTASYAATKGSHATGAPLPPLRDVSFAVEPGELVAVLGPNGAGKSTMLRVLSGELAPIAGEARLFGEPLAEMDRRDIARSVAVVAQSDEIAFRFPVREVVAMGRAPHQGGLMRATARDRDAVDRAMARCDLEKLASRPVDELSGGEKRRVAIARALAQEPRVLLLDEPAAYLDVRHQIDLHELLAEEVASSKLACVVSLHDLNVAAQYATRVALLSEGELVGAGSVEEMMTYSTLKSVFGADLYVGVNELTGDRFFLPMRKRADTSR